MSEETAGNPWGLWATIFMGLGVGVVVFAVEAAVIAVALDKQGGLLLSISTCVNALICTLLLLGLAGLRKGITVRDYLAFRPVPKGMMLRFLGLALLAATIIDGLTLLFGRPLVPQVMVDAYRTAGSHVLYWTALVLAAPVGEELLFRGFLFKGLLHSRLGARGAIFLTALAWAAIHLQYDLFNMGVVFLLGLLFGYGRLVSGSICMPLVMHAALNFIATSEIGFFLRMA